MDSKYADVSEIRFNIQCKGTVDWSYLHSHLCSQGKAFDLHQVFAEVYIKIDLSGADTRLPLIRQEHTQVYLV